MRFLTHVLQDEDPAMLPPHWKPPLPNLKRDNEDENCPSPTALSAVSTVYESDIRMNYP